MENDDQTHPSDTLCLAFNAVRNALTGAAEQCTYKASGYYGGECKCNCGYACRLMRTEGSAGRPVNMTFAS